MMPTGGLQPNHMIWETDACLDGTASSHRPYENLNLANQKGWKIGISGRKLEASQFSCSCHFGKC